MKKISSLVAVSVSLLISACGGGGSSSNTPSSPIIITPPVTTPTITPANLQTNVTAPNYSMPQAANVFNAINNFRANQGLGLVKQDLSLDISTDSHNKYCDINQCYSHTQEPSKLGFTGITPGDRAVYTNYGSASVTEVAASQSYLVPEGVETSLVNSLINTVYHREVLMNQAVTDIGVSYLVKSTMIQGQTSPLFTVYLYVDLGLKKMQNNASDFVTVYPRDNQSDVTLFMNTELPNPVPDISVTQNEFSRKTSSPVSFTVALGKTLKVKTFKIKNALTNMDFPARLITQSTDSLMNLNSAYLVGYQPFEKNTKYIVEFDGLSNGTEITKTWSFTTGTKTPF